MNRIRWLLASRTRAWRTLSMKKIAALQILVNTIDPIIMKDKVIRHNICTSYCVSREKQSSVAFFDEMSGRAYACLLLKKVRFASLIAVSYRSFLSQFLILGRFV